MIRAVIVLLLTAALLAACRDDGSTPQPDVTASPATSSTPSTPAASGCTGTPVTTGDTAATITSGGIERTYILHVPPQYDGDRPMPLVLNFHGFGSGARQQHNYSQLPAKADAEGFIVVSPQGTGDRPQWNNQQIAGLPDDVAFVEELLDSLAAQLCIDATRIYAAGISNGAAFSQRLACELPERIAGIAPVAATFYPLNCASRKPIPVIAFHGTADACVPYDGGPVTCGRGTGGIPIPSTEFGASRWAQHNACNPQPAETQFTPNVRVIAYSECRENVAVLLYAVEGGGHTWPGAIDVPRLGATTQEIDATDLLWEFFEGQAQ